MDPSRTLAQRAAAVGLTDRGSLVELALWADRLLPSAPPSRQDGSDHLSTAHPPITLLSLALGGLRAKPSLVLQP